MIGCSKAGRNTMMVRVATINTTIQGKQRARTTRHGTGHHLRASKKVKPATLTTKITACQNQMKAEINSLCCLISKLQAQRNSSTASSQWRLSSWTLGPNEALGEWSSLVHCDHERGSAHTQNQIFRPGKGEAISRVRWRYATLARSFVGRWRLGCPRCLQLKLVRFPVPRCGV